MKTIQSIILTALTLLVCSCTKEKHYYLTEMEKQMVPYQIGDTVYVKDSQGKRVILTVKGKETQWESYDYEIKQFQKTHVQSELGDFSFTVVIMAKRDCIEVINRTTSRQIRLWYDKRGNFISPVLDSVIIGNRVYRDVAHRSIVYNENTTEELYYNKTHGVLQIRINGKPTLTLDTLIFAGER